ncbi:LysE family translocator [Ilyomonas limi]|uniref:LysE family translocator n=1 Tax=Ilyomonas limi TaxID=2575867 RepID=UPI001485AD10|nr:LysE family transporter [Ilyomonas limi]
MSSDHSMLFHLSLHFFGFNMDVLLTLLLGLLVSFLGQLPLGNLNIIATQIGLEENFKKAWLFSIGAAIVEMIYLRIALSGMNWVVAHQTFFTILNWVAILLFLTLGILSFTMAHKQAADKKTILLNNKINRFVLGVTMSAVNPVQIPFWFTWGITLINAGLLYPNNLDYNMFTIGAGTGTIAGLAVYIHAGNRIAKKLKASNKGMNKFMGAVFIFTALIQLYKVVIVPMMK